MHWAHTRFSTAQMKTLLNWKRGTKLLTQETPELSSSHGSAKCTATRTAILSERNPGTKWMTSLIHRVNVGAPTWEWVQKAETHSPQTLPLAQCHTIRREPHSQLLPEESKVWITSSTTTVKASTKLRKPEEPASESPTGLQQRSSS